MGIESWSSVAASNNSTPPNGAPEGMSAAAVNNTMRQNMASVREWYEGNGWTDLGDTPTYVSATSFTVSDNQTAFYTAGRPIRCTDSTTLYGVVLSSSYSAPNTTVTVKLNSNLSASLSAVALSFQAGASLVASGSFTPALLDTGSTLAVTYVDQYGHFFRFGPFVFVMSRLRVSAISAAGTGNLEISGMPYASALPSGMTGSSGFTSVMPVAASDFTPTVADFGGLIADVRATTTNMVLRQVGSGNSRTLLPSNSLATNAQFDFAGWYVAGFA